jgi:hypothetical protein
MYSSQKYKAKSKHTLQRSTQPPTMQK